RQREAIIQRDAFSRDDRPRAIENLTVCFVLIEPRMQEAADEIAGLRLAARRRPLDATCYRVGCAGGIGFLVLEEGANIAERSKADAEHWGILRRVGDLIDAVRLEAAFDAELGRIRRAGERILGAALRPGPIGGFDLLLAFDLAVHGFVGAAD